jgi:hypothetical protein
MRTAAYQEKNKLRKQDATSRITFLDALAEAKAQAGTGTAEKEKEAMIRREAQRRNAAFIRSVNKKTRAGGIRSVLAPHPQTGLDTEMSSKEDIERACLAENERQFRQASNTPFLSDPLAPLVGHMGFGPAAEDILQGTFVAPAGTDEYAALLLKHMRMPENVRNRPKVDVSLSVSIHCTGWSKSKERTSSGRSGIHFGHFKAGALHTGIARFDATMANIPYQTGYAPSLWQHGINTILLKTKGDYRVGKL